MARTVRLQKQRKVVDKARQQVLSKRLFDNTALAQQMIKVIEMSVYMGMKDLPRLLSVKTKTAINVKTIESACNNIRLNLNEVVKVDPNFEDMMEMNIVTNYTDCVKTCSFILLSIYQSLMMALKSNIMKEIAKRDIGYIVYNVRYITLFDIVSVRIRTKLFGVYQSYDEALIKALESSKGAINECKMFNWL